MGRTKLKVGSGESGEFGDWGLIYQKCFKLDKLQSHETVESEVKVRTLCPAGYLTAKVTKAFDGVRQSKEAKGICLF